ncbi:hypothetical protein DERP_002836 [Dermatophagoides pteronyssinus]|uniref:Uncharacterized protein n=1 Tax=Dermatophagoides pteronyssinus TaxID=6956 RepID=A0ABQ8JVV2_DERPT|nr:hypothetical protein DERP_002836 [Dermatophagoides pteronyssinus]
MQEKDLRSTSQVNPIQAIDQMARPGTYQFSLVFKLSQVSGLFPHGLGQKIDLEPSGPHRIYKAKQQQQKTGNPFPANPGATITFIEHKSKTKAAALKYTRYPIRFDL